MEYCPVIHWLPLIDLNFQLLTIGSVVWWQLYKILHGYRQDEEKNILSIAVLTPEWAIRPKGGKQVKINALQPIIGSWSSPQSNINKLPNTLFII